MIGNEPSSIEERVDYIRSRKESGFPLRPIDIEFITEIEKSIEAKKDLKDESSRILEKYKDVKLSLLVDEIYVKLFELTFVGLDSIKRQKTRYMEIEYCKAYSTEILALGMSRRIEIDEIYEELMKSSERNVPPTPPFSVKDDDSLHICISYKHYSEPDGRRLGKQQAERLKAGILDLMDESGCTSLRIWSDNYLHVNKKPKETEWHLAGMAPYACLPIATGLGKGDCIIDRPWLWLETIAGICGLGLWTEKKACGLKMLQNG